MKSYGTSNNILMKPSNALTKSLVVDGSSITTDVDNNKYISAGQFLTSSDDVEIKDDAVLTPTNDASQAKAILQYDTIFKDGNKLIAVILSGVINRAQMSDEMKKLYTDDAVKQLKTALPHVQIVDNPVR